MNILITGGSRGIGAAAVRLFCARGDSVWFLYEKRHEAGAGAFAGRPARQQSAAMWQYEAAGAGGIFFSFRRSTR